MVSYESTTGDPKRSNPLSVAIQGKGLSGLLRRAGEITGRYGLTPAKIDHSFAYFVEILTRFGVGGTFPVPGVILRRNRLPQARYERQKIEIALHGYLHVDHTRLPFDKQVEGIQRGLRMFQEQGLTCDGFRGPYLRASEETLDVLRTAGFLYDSSQGIAWDVLNRSSQETYEHVLAFYRAVAAADYPSLPRLERGLVRIPYSLPDDEAFINRLHFESSEVRSQVWLAILEETYRLGEVFVLGLHPERIRTCDRNLIETLQAAQERSPAIWIARLNDIARWWKARLATEITVQGRDDHHTVLTRRGPEGVVFLARGVELASDSSAWDGTYRIITGDTIRYQSPVKPFIGLSQRAPASLEYFLRQQGFLVEVTGSPLQYAHYLDYPVFAADDERKVLMEIEEADFPLVRLGRWPNGARSVLSISGDIEGYTLWDYGMRFLGH